MGKRTFAELAPEPDRRRPARHDTPALMAESVSTPEQTFLRATVGTLAAQIPPDSDGPA